ncbi:MAG: hypothetical protein P1V18_03125 [Candidatus Gracilibacteria bacterium]|nr:hypothetical protein [Candidatus Gracilibacteria bacterium]
MCIIEGILKKVNRRVDLLLVLIEYGTEIMIKNNNSQVERTTKSNLCGAFLGAH